MTLNAGAIGAGSAALRMGAVGIVVMLVAGCGAKRSAFGNRFVKQGEPQVTFDEPAPAAPPRSLGEYARQLRELQAKATTKRSLLPTIESSNPRLAAALVRLAVQETAANHRAVAAEYRAIGVSDYAHRHLQRALRLEPCDSIAFEELARLWRDWGHPELALGDAHRAIYCRPSSASAYNTLGTVLQALDQPANARRAFEMALALDRKAAFALNNLCYLALQEGNAEEAQRSCERALAVEPRMTVATNNLALAQAIKGNVEAAETLLLRAPEPSTAHFNVGILRMSLGRYEEAARAFELADAARPSLGIAAQHAAQARQLADAQKGAE